MIVAFDADDTLWHNEDKFQETHRAFESLLAPWADATAINDHLNDVQRANIPRYGFGAKSFMLSMMETALDLSEHEVPPESLREIIALGKAILDRPTEVLPGVHDVLASLDHLTLMMITKGDLYAQHASIEKSGLAEYFWRIDVVAHKDAATYREVLDRHDVPIDRFVMVGNSVKSDILPVLELGGRGVHVPYHVTWTLEEPDDDHGHEFPTLETLTDLPDLLESWS
ncbi:MAG: HAD family hydrolase [Actinomycetota bacterium]